MKSLLEETNFWIFNFSKQSTGCTDQNVIKCIQEISRIISKIIIITSHRISLWIFFQKHALKHQNNVIYRLKRYFHVINDEIPLQITWFSVLNFTKTLHSRDYRNVPTTKSEILRNLDNLIVYSCNEARVIKL